MPIVGDLGETGWGVEGREGGMEEKEGKGERGNGGKGKGRGKIGPGRKGEAVRRVESNARKPRESKEGCRERGLWKRGGSGGKRCNERGRWFIVQLHSSS